MRQAKYGQRIPDFTLVIIVLVLVLIGILMVYSSSYVWAEYKYGDAYFFVKRQLLFVILGILSMIILYLFPYHRLKTYVNVILMICFFLLLLVLVPGIGIVRGGAQSWIGVGAFSIQPAEFIKLGLILFLARYLADNEQSITTFWRGFFFPIVFILCIFGLIMLQPDFGTGVVLVITCVLMVFIAGARLIYFIFFMFIGLIGLVILIISAPYRINRITAYLNPWNDPLGDGFQIIQSLYAIGPGKLLGVGFGNSLQKYFYLPEPQTDFIFAIVGEELGFLGGTAVIILFFLLCFRGIRVSTEVIDSFGRYVAIGIITMITVQVMINISVVIGLIPVTGITLPFLSYGGSSLTLSLASIGILLNISTYTTKF